MFRIVVTATERVQVKQFFHDSALGKNPTVRMWFSVVDVATFIELKLLSYAQRPLVLIISNCVLFLKVSACINSCE